MDLVRPKIRDFAAEVLAQGGMTSPARRHLGRLVIVTFHRVLPEQFRSRYHIPGIVVTPEELDWTIRYLRRSYTIGRLDHVHGRHEAGDAPSKPFVAITFDDGYADNFTYARPILEKHGVKATFFVPAAFIGRGAYRPPPPESFASSSRRRGPSSISVGPDLPDLARARGPQSPES